MSLSSCLTQAGTALDPEDKAAILDRSRELRGQGVSVADAALQSVEERLSAVQRMLADAEGPPVQDESQAAPEAEPADENMPQVESADSAP